VHQINESAKFCKSFGFLVYGRRTDLAIFHHKFRKASAQVPPLGDVVVLLSKLFYSAIEMGFLRCPRLN
jgi:hypothetical protein